MLPAAAAITAAADSCSDPVGTAAAGANTGTDGSGFKMLLVATGPGPRPLPGATGAGPSLPLPLPPADARNTEGGGAIDVGRFAGARIPLPAQLLAFFSSSLA